MSLPTTDSLLAVVGQETADADHLAKHVLNDVQTGIDRTHLDFDEIYSRLSKKYFDSGKIAHLWILECLRRLLELEEEDDDSDQ
jgi:hypothetical protein